MYSFRLSFYILYRVLKKWTLTQNFTKRANILTDKGYPTMKIPNLHSLLEREEAVNSDIGPLRCLGNSKSYMKCIGILVPMNESKANNTAALKVPAFKHRGGLDELLVSPFDLSCHHG